jgi:NADPH2:quinone reductase
MRAALYRKPGPSSVLEVVDRPRPRASEGEVLVSIARAGVNPTDWKGRSRGPLSFPEVTPGEDGAGTVVEVGDGVSSLVVGDRVWVMLAQHERPYGTSAELVSVPSSRAHRLPTNASLDLGAALGIPAVTAHRALVSGRALRLGPGALTGSTVLVPGGAGAVGNAAIQLATWSGATVLATASSDEKMALARAAGAHHVYNYRDPEVAGRIRATAPAGVDLIIEVAPAVNRDLDLDVLADGGVVAVYGTEGGADVHIPVRQAWGKNCSFHFLLVYGFDAQALEEAAQDVNAAVAAGALQVGRRHGLPVHHYPLESVAAAHDAVEGGVVGKVLLDVG